MNRACGICRDERGATIVEFALLAPLILGLLLGVVQISLSAQSYNAMRSIASDTARYAVVELQKENTTLNDAALKAYAESRASSALYNLDSGFTASVANATNQRVTGATEKTITVTYTAPAVLPFLGWLNPTMTFSRPIFLLQP